MPKSPIGENFPAWVDEISDPCLWMAVREAIRARGSALDRGIGERDVPRSCRNVFRAGESTLQAIADGRVVSPQACGDAAVALRKYTAALECVHPTTRRANLGD